VENRGRGAVFIGAGGNLTHPLHGPPRQTLEAALQALAQHGVQLLRVSPWYCTAPVPASDQPWFVNAVAEVATALDARELLAVLHAVERDFGRVRSVPNAPRIVDLDLLDFRGEISAGGEGAPVLPHPRLQQRAFVLRPLADLEPQWRHPVSRHSIATLLAALPADQKIERL
jgi:2-amino-4-hydroxy-6-hydroxymethyldihydropteridine diphosphokinase